MYNRPLDVGVAVCVAADCGIVADPLCLPSTSSTYQLIFQTIAARKDADHLRVEWRAPSRKASRHC